MNKGVNICDHAQPPPVKMRFRILYNFVPGRSGKRFAVFEDACYRMEKKEAMKKRSRILLVLSAAVVCASLCIAIIGRVRHEGQPAAQGPRSDIFTFDISSNPNFKSYKEVITRFSTEHRPGLDNHFCIIGVVSEDTKSAWVLWSEGARDHFVGRRDRPRSFASNYPSRN